MTLEKKIKARGIFRFLQTFNRHSPAEGGINHKVIPLQAGLLGEPANKEALANSMGLFCLCVLGQDARVLQTEEVEGDSAGHPLTHQMF